MHSLNMIVVVSLKVHESNLLVTDSTRCKNYGIPKILKHSDSTITPAVAYRQSINKGPPVTSVTNGYNVCPVFEGR